MAERSAANLHDDGCGKPWGLCECEPRPAGKQAWIDKHMAVAHDLAVNAANEQRCPACGADRWKIAGPTATGMCECEVCGRVFSSRAASDAAKDQGGFSEQAPETVSGGSSPVRPAACICDPWEIGKTPACPVHGSSAASTREVNCPDCWKGKAIPCAVNCRELDECCDKRLGYPCARCGGSGVLRVSA